MKVRYLLLTTIFLSTSFVHGGEGVWLGVGYGGRRMVASDGLEWEITAEWAQPGKDDGNNLMSVVFAQDKFVVVGGGGGGPNAAGHILVSEDGRAWNEVFTGFGYQRTGQLLPHARTSSITWPCTSVRRRSKPLW